MHMHSDLYQSCTSAGWLNACYVTAAVTCGSATYTYAAAGRVLCGVSLQHDVAIAKGSVFGCIRVHRYKQYACDCALTHGACVVVAHNSWQVVK
jgi:hypothetical protein